VQIVAMKSKSTLKTVIIGLDGATFNFILPFIGEGKLPTFKYLLQKGAWGELESTIPPVTAAAWPSFLTGQNPGKHGILNFLQAGSANISGNQEGEIVTTKNFAGRTFIDIMSNHGLRIGVITVPVTYPPWKLNGVMISGYPSPDNDKIYSISEGYSFTLSEPLNFSAAYYKHATQEEILRDCLHRDNLRSLLAFDLFGRYEFDCFIIVFGGIDRAQHNYWKYFDPNYPGVSDAERRVFRDAIFLNYKFADEQIARFLAHFGARANIFIISDHGAGRHPFHFFHGNSWLRHGGFLKLNLPKALAREAMKRSYRNLKRVLTPSSKSSTTFLSGIKAVAEKKGGGIARIFDWSQTSAFFHALQHPVGGIVINLKGRQPKGCVHPGKEYKNLVDAILHNLLDYTDPATGRKVIQEAKRREDIYAGPYVENFPDIVYTLNPHYTPGTEIFGSPISKVPTFRLSKLSGVHQMKGIFIAHGPKIRSVHLKGARIIDIAPTVLASNGLPIPQSMDGAVLKETFIDGAALHSILDEYELKPETETEGFSLEENEIEEMKDKLRSLGYI